jgi:adenine phosphoribosyltransferase
VHDLDVTAPLGIHHAHIGTQELDLPVMAVSDDVAIALLITVDQGVSFAARAGRELAELLEPFHVQVVASVATMGIPIAIEVSRALGIDDYLVLQKTPKIHLGDALSEPVRSITTGGTQRLLFDRNRVGVAKGRPVALVDDVISTGASMRAALALLRRAGGDPVAVGVLATEGTAWKETLGPDAELVRSLGKLPLLRREPDGVLRDIA